MAERLASALGGEGQVIAADSLDHLGQLVNQLAEDDPPSAIAVHGGDGTLHKSLSALVRAWRGRPLPPIAVLRGGTMNVVASSLGLDGRPEAVVADLAAAARGGRPLPVIERRCLEVKETSSAGGAGSATYGFVFGNGLMANFLEEYYSREAYGPGRAVWMLTRTFGSALIDGPYARKIFRRFEGQVLVDGKQLPWSQLTGVGAATVREVGLGFKLNHPADDDLHRFGVLAIHASALSLARDLHAVHRGRGISPKRAFSDVASNLRVDSAGKECVYTIDGDLYRTRDVLEVALGPVVRFYKPT
jgi:diacylglycerol kinase (ATP)